MPFAQAAGVADMVREAPRRLPYLDALGVLARSDALLLIGSDEPHYTASKIYPALMSSRPYLSLFHAASSAHQILSEAGGGVALSFSNDEDLAVLVPDLARALRMLVEHGHTFGPPNQDAVVPYSAEHVARRFASIFDRVANP